MNQAHGTLRRGRTSCRALGLTIGLGVLTGIAACENGNVPSNLVVPINSGLVTTFNDSTFNFASLRTFAMPDTVVHLFPLGGGPPIAVTRMFDQAVLDQVRQNLLDRGFIQVANPAVTRPDFVVLVGATATPEYNAWVGYSWFTFWGFYSGWKFFTPGFSTAWGIVYPWFGLIGTTSYSPGTLIVDLIPTATINTDNQSVTSAWAGVGTGLLNAGVNQASVMRSIDQMFALSPYLTPATTP
jgi:hypothetical protein